MVLEDTLTNTQSTEILASKLSFEIEKQEHNFSAHFVREDFVHFWPIDKIAT